MPLTCSHPAAILPFKCFTPRHLNFAALMIGSMSPDAGYFIGERGLAKLAHHPIGTVVIGIPTGLVLLGLFYFIRREFCFILPSPHRNRLTPLAHQKPVFTFEALLIAILSILVGAATHIVWDQFTHDGTYAFRHFAPLRISLTHIGPQDITIAYVLQYISTLAGGGILAFCYFKWLRSQPSKPDNEPDSWRYFLWYSLALLSLAAGTLMAIHLSAPIHEFHTFREFVYKMGVISVSVFTLLIVVSAVLCYRPKLASAIL